MGMGFLFFLLLVFVGYIVIRYREAAFPLIKRALSDLQSDFQKFKAKNTPKGNSAIVTPYEQKAQFFNDSEHEFFRVLNSHIDAQRYTIFPKVRLCDVVEVIKQKGRKNWGAWNKIKSKHVDFLVWDLVESKVVLAIELDGKSHESKGKFVPKNDYFKDGLFEKVGLVLVRVKVGTNFEEQSKSIAERLA